MVKVFIYNGGSEEIENLDNKDGQIVVITSETE
jgi:hypothetical protein